MDSNNVGFVDQYECSHVYHQIATGIGFNGVSRLQLAHVPGRMRLAIYI